MNDHVSKRYLRSLLEKLQLDPNFRTAIWEISQKITSRRDYISYLQERPRERFSISDDQELLDALQILNLAHNSSLLVEIHFVHNCLFFTDPHWSTEHDASYPFFDECDALLTWGRRNSPGETIFDLTTGCGHVCIAWPGKPKRVLMDINERSLLFARINCILNSIHGAVFHHYDIRNGLPDAVLNSNVMGKRVVFVANPPFVPSLRKVKLNSNIDGGISGLEYSIACINAVADFARLANGIEVRLALLTLSAGNLDTDRWEILDAVSRMHQSKRVSWSIQHNQKVWRINGQKRFANPMPIVGHLTTRAACEVSSASENRTAAEQQFMEIETSMTTSGWTHIGLGVLEIAF